MNTPLNGALDVPVPHNAFCHGKHELQDEPAISKRDVSAHTKAQSERIGLGKLTGCAVWMASNDQGRIYALTSHGLPI